MFDLMETQTVPAAPRRAWVMPELRSLDLRNTLVGPVAFSAELNYSDPDPRDGEPYSHASY